MLVVCRLSPDSAHVDTSEARTSGGVDPISVVRFVALRDGEPIARMALRRDTCARATIGAPVFEESVPQGERSRVFDLLLSESSKVAFSAGCTYVEANPSSFTPNLQEWKTALEK